MPTGSERRRPRQLPWVVVFPLDEALVAAIADCDELDRDEDAVFVDVVDDVVPELLARVVVDVVADSARQPVSATSAVTLAAPATRRARRAGWGRRRRALGVARPVRSDDRGDGWGAGSFIGGLHS